MQINWLVFICLEERPYMGYWHFNLKEIEINFLPKNILGSENSKKIVKIAVLPTIVMSIEIKNNNTGL